METFERLCENLFRRGFSPQCFDTGEAAAAYLESELSGFTIGFGGSETLRALNLYERLGAHNRVLWHWRDEAERIPAFSAPVFITSANAVAETGEIINIDAGGNRVAASCFGPQRLIYIIGINKLTPNLESAFRRARNVAAPRNCVRLNRKTPCVETPDQCWDCSSPDRLCKVMSIHFGRPLCIPRADVLLVNEMLGY